MKSDNSPLPVIHTIGERKTRRKLYACVVLAYLIGVLAGLGLAHLGGTTP